MKRREETIQVTKQPYIEDVGPRKIKSIQFSLFSESEILKQGEVEIYRGAYYESTKKPIPNGLLDPHMGPPNKNGCCETCHGNFRECPGHYGYLVLALPVYNVGYLGTVVDILKCICKCCSSILLNDKDRRDHLKSMRNPRTEFLKKCLLQKKVVRKCTAMTSGQKTVTCSKCGYMNGMVKKGQIKIIHERGNRFLDEPNAAISHKKELRASVSVPPEIDPKTVFSLFKNMSDEDCELLYLNDRPEKLLVTSIPVPPTSIRPSVFVDGGTQSNENDISERLKRIIQANASLLEEMSDPSPYNKSLSPWVDLQMEVAQYINSDVRGVPLHMQEAKQLSGFSQRLKGKQGRFRGNLSGKRVEYTGRTVISPDPNLKITEVAIPILMARILTYPERVSQHNIEKLRQCVRNGPNKYPGAKFIRHPDGTEISLMFSSRKRHADELKFGYIVDRHLEDGDIVLFNRQPSLHRMSIMSHRARIMPWRTLRFNESVCNPYNADFDGDEMNMHVPQTEEARTEALMLMGPVELWTGKQLFGVLLRPYSKIRVYVNLTVTEKSYSGKEETMCPSDGFVYFRNSELISGQLGKATLGNGNKDGLYSVLLRDYKSHAAATCMNRLAKLSARWIGNHGFSIGIDDVTPGETLVKQKQGEIDRNYKKCEDCIQQFNEGKLAVQPGCDAAQTLEAEVTMSLNKVRDDIGKICMKALHWRNSPLIMSQCGSKGSPINISQMIACVGQQSVGGRRAPDGFIDRSLPHFPFKSKFPAAKGFVAHSFFDGLSATEFFFHTMGGREGLVDTAVKTADTGYMSRRLMKALEDLAVYYDSTVRNASASIIQFMYGDDGMDPAQMEEKKGRPLNFNRLFMKVKATCPPGGEKSLSYSEICKIVNERLSYHDMTPEGGCSEAFRASLSDFLIKNLAETLKKLREVLFLGEEQYAGDGREYLENIALNISGITKKQLQVFLNTCISRYHLKTVESGTAIGAIGAQSIGEPGTQMTLKTFHFAGVASMNVTLGVPRIKEIINAAKNITTPIITTKLLAASNLTAARMIKARIEKTLLGQVSKSIKIVMASRLASIRIALDMETIQVSQLCIDAYTVKQSILTAKLKVTEHQVKVLNPRKLEVFPPADIDKHKLHFELHRLKNKLPGVVVKGITTVQRAVVNKEQQKDRKSDVKGETYELLVEGEGLLAVMGIEGVDGSNTKSNHIMEVQKTLGIEASRVSIIDEINYTMSSHGMTIDLRHMMLLADLMTYKGEVLGITRHGVQKMKDSVLMLASFEKTTDHLFNASVNGRDDKIEGVSECIIMGVPMQIGTGMFKLRQCVEQVELNYQSEPMIS